MPYVIITYSTVLASADTNTCQSTLNQRLTDVVVVHMNRYDGLVDEFLAGLRSAAPAKGTSRVLYPGLSEAEEMAKRSVEGIPYHREVVEWFRSFGEEHGLPGCAALGGSATGPARL